MAAYIKLFLPVFFYLFFLVLNGQETTSQNDRLETVNEYINKGRSLYYEEEYEKSIEYFDQAITISKNADNYTLSCMATILKGHSYLMNDQNQEALDAYYSGIAIAKENKDLYREIAASTGLVLVYKKTNQYEKALGLSRRMIQLINKTPFKKTKTHVNVITTGSEVYLDTEQYDSVIYYADQGIALSTSLDYKEGLVDLYIKKGVVFYHKEQYKEALSYLFKAEEILQKHEVRNKFYPTVNSNYFVASCYYKQQSYDKAITRLHKAIDISEKNDLLKIPVLQSHLLLANCYAEKEDFENALYWNNTYVTLNEAYQKRKDKTINKIYQKDAQKLKGSIENLQYEHEKDERIKKYTGIGLLLISLLLIGIVFAYLKKQRSNKQLFTDLIKKIDALEAQEKEVITKKDITKEIVIDDEKVHGVLKGLARLEQQEFYLRSDCNLRAIAKKVKTNATYLSKIINIHKEKNFNEYINDLRIDYVVKRLKNDRKFRSFSIKSIATEIGYKSDYSFAKHFKAKTGLNPSYYIKNIEKQETALETVA